MGKTSDQEGKEGEDRTKESGVVSVSSAAVGFSTGKNPIWIFFGRMLRKIRKVRGESIYSLAKKAKVDAGYISRLENAHRTPPSPRILKRFADALDVQVNLLMMAAGYLEADINSGDPLSEKEIIRRIETELFKDLESEAIGDLTSLEEQSSEFLPEDAVFSTLPLLEKEDPCLGVTEDGDSIVGKARLYLLTNTGVEEVSCIQGKLPKVDSE